MSSPKTLPCSHSLCFRGFGPRPFGPSLLRTWCPLWPGNGMAALTTWCYAKCTYDWPISRYHRRTNDVATAIQTRLKSLKCIRKRVCGRVFAPDLPGDLIVYPWLFTNCFYSNKTFNTWIPLSHSYYHLFDVNDACFNKIRSIYSETQTFKHPYCKSSVSNTGIRVQKYHPTKPCKNAPYRQPFPASNINKLCKATFSRIALIYFVIREWQ